MNVASTTTPKRRSTIIDIDEISHGPREIPHAASPVVDTPASKTKAKPQFGFHRSPKVRPGITQDCIGLPVVVTGYGTGWLRYYGPCPLAKSANDTWLGVELESASGDCNGSIEGEMYFNCADNHGIFVEMALGAVQVAYNCIISMTLCILLSNRDFSLRF